MPTLSDAHAALRRRKSRRLWRTPKFPSGHRATSVNAASPPESPEKRQMGYTAEQISKLIDDLLTTLGFGS